MLYPNYAKPYNAEVAAEFIGIDEHGIVTYAEPDGTISTCTEDEWLNTAV